MVDVFTIVFALVIFVAVERWPRPVRPITVFFLALLTGAWLWANLYDSGWKEVWGGQIPERLDPFTKAMFYRGWPLAPFMVCIIYFNIFQPNGLEGLVLVVDWLILIAALFLARFASERCFHWRERRTQSANALHPQESFREEGKKLGPALITTTRPDCWRALSRVLTFCCVLAVAQPIVRLRAQEPAAAPADPFFANEPNRPKAAAPIVFSRSWDDARAEAKRSGRRLVAYFTSDWCGWCRALEKRTFFDAEVVALAKQFVCVEIDIRNDKSLRLADEYQIDSIPRTYVFTPDGRVIDRRTGYLAATEFASWLKNVATTPPAPVADAQKPKPPAPVGAGQEESDVVIWFVDATKSMDRWSDRDWTGHLQLLQVLHAAGLHPRVEHVARADFPARWDSAVAANKAPDVISADNGGGLIRSLRSLGRFLLVRSDRLSWMTDISSCPDFKGRWLFVVNDSRHAATGKIAVRELLRPGPETSLPGTELPAIAGAPRPSTWLAARSWVMSGVTPIFSSRSPHHLRPSSLAAPGPMSIAAGGSSRPGRSSFAATMRSHSPMSRCGLRAKT